MTSDDRSLRTEYDRLVSRVLAGARRPGGTGQADSGVDTDAVLAHFKARLSQRPRSLTELGALIEALSDSPSAQAKALAWLAMDAERQEDAAMLACRAWALAAERFYDVGDDESFQGAARSLLARAESTRWRVHAERLLGNAPRAQPAATRELHEAAWPGPAFADQICSLATPVTFGEAEVICEVGAHADAMFVIRTGRVAISLGAGQMQRVFRFRGPGDIVGEMGLYVPARTRTASATATGPVEAWRVPYAALESAANADLLQAGLAARYCQRRTEIRIAQHPLFASLDLAARSELLAAVIQAPGWVEPGATLATVGSSRGGVLFVLDGSVDLVLTTSDTAELARVRREATDRSGELIGLDALSGVKQWPYGVVAQTRCCVATVPAEGLRRVLDESQVAQLPTFILNAPSFADV